MTRRGSTFRPVIARSPAVWLGDVAIRSPVFDARNESVGPVPNGIKFSGWGALSPASRVLPRCDGEAFGWQSHSKPPHRSGFERPENSPVDLPSPLGKVARSAGRGPQRERARPCAMGPWGGGPLAVEGPPGHSLTECHWGPVPVTNFNCAQLNESIGTCPRVTHGPLESNKSRQGFAPEFLIPHS